MSFFGRSFVFDGTPCEAFGLMLYDISEQDSDIKASGAGSIEEETVGDKWRPYFYGIKPTGKLEFDLVFGVNERRIDNGKCLDRWEISQITNWLCRHDAYRWLYIDQPDMRRIGYRCMISEPVATRYGSVPWAFRVHVTCDSRFAYAEPVSATVTVDGENSIGIYNESALAGWYYPQITFVMNGGTSLSITNSRDNGRGPVLTDIPQAITTITIDNEHCVLDNDQGLNLYDGFNFQFLRLAHGDNTINITGQGTVTIQCEFPVNVGG